MRCNIEQLLKKRQIVDRLAGRYTRSQRSGKKQGKTHRIAESLRRRYAEYIRRTQGRRGVGKNRGVEPTPLPIFRLRSPKICNKDQGLFCSC